MPSLVVIDPERYLTVDGDAILIRQLVFADSELILEALNSEPQSSPKINIMSQEKNYQNNMIPLGLFENGVLSCFVVVAVALEKDTQGDNAGVVVAGWNAASPKILTNGFDRNRTLLYDYLYDKLASQGIFSLYWRWFDSTLQWTTNDQLGANNSWEESYVEMIPAGEVSSDEWVRTHIMQVATMPSTVRKMKKVD